MGDGGWVIGAVTGATAILTALITGRQSYRAARYQIDRTAAERRADALRDTRRAAYTALTDAAHELGSIYGDVTQIIGPPPHPEAVPALKTCDRDLRRIYHEAFRPALERVALEGPDDVVEATYALRYTVRDLRRTVGALVDGVDDAALIERFRQRKDQLWTQLEYFTERGRRAITD